MKKIASAVALTFGLTVVSVGAVQADEVPVGTSPENPILVGDPSEVPEGAVENEVSTYLTPAACDTTRSWVLTIPAEEDSESVRLKREVPAVPEKSHQEYRFKKVVPGEHHEAVTHEEYRYEREVKTYKTLYHFRKFVRTKTKAPSVDPQHYSWTGKKRAKDDPPTVVPPHKDWQANSKHEPHSNATWVNDSLHYTAASDGHAAWFYFVEGASYDWSAYGPWEPYVPETHTSWEDSDEPLGQPQHHSSGTYSDGTKWERQWQAQHDGQTKQVESGTKTEDSGWVLDKPAGNGWTLVDTKTVTDEESYTDPDVTLYYTGAAPSENVADAAWVRYAPSGDWTQLDEKKVVDVQAVPAFTEFFTLLGSPFPILEELAEWVHEDAAPAQGWVEFDRKSNEDGAPEQVIYYAWTDGKECDKPEGYEDVETTTECVDGDLVTTETVTTGTPVQNEEDGSWSIEETATSSQSVEKGAEECAAEEPPTEEPPTKGDPKPEPPVKDSPTPPITVPTAVNAGVGGDETTEPMAAVNLMAGVGVGLLVMSLIVLFISRSEELEE